MALGQSFEFVQSGTIRDQSVFPTVCRIRVPDGGGHSLGSGTCVYSSRVLGKSYIVTAAHVIRGGRGAPTATFPDGQTLTCSVVYNNPQKDVTVLVANGVRPSYTPLNDELPKRGDVVTFVGYGGTRPYFLAYAGRVTGSYGSGPGSGADQLEAMVPQISQGDSGGAVFFDGKLVAIISAKDNQGHGIACLVCYKNIQQNWRVR